MQKDKKFQSQSTGDNRRESKRSYLTQANTVKKVQPTLGQSRNFEVDSATATHAINFKPLQQFKAGYKFTIFCLIVLRHRAQRETHLDKSWNTRQF